MGLKYGTIRVIMGSYLGCDVDIKHYIYDTRPDSGAIVFYPSKESPQKVKDKGMASIVLDRDCPITSYQYLGCNDNTSSSYSLLKGALGAAVIGPLGLIAGAGGKKSGEKVYLIQLNYTDGKTSLLSFYKQKGCTAFIDLLDKFKVPEA